MYFILSIVIVVLLRYRFEMLDPKCVINIPTGGLHTTITTHGDNSTISGYNYTSTYKYSTVHHSEIIMRAGAVSAGKNETDAHGTENDHSLVGRFINATTEECRCSYLRSHDQDAVVRNSNPIL